MEAKGRKFVINESEYKTNAKLRQINGRGNSSVFQLQQKNSENLFIKVYPEEDGQERLVREFESLIRLKNHRLNCLQPVKKDEQLNIAAFEWLDGIQIENPTEQDIDEVLAFLRKLRLVEKQGVFDDMKPAALLVFRERILNCRSKVDSLVY